MLGLLKKEEEEERMPNHDFFTLHSANVKLHYYSNVIHLFDWKSAVKHNGSVYNT